MISKKEICAKVKTVYSGPAQPAKGGGRYMEKTRHYEFEGVTLEIPLHYDELSQMFIEEYPDFVKNPIYTPEGCPVFFNGEDACPFAEAAEGEDCPEGQALRKGENER